MFALFQKYVSATNIKIDFKHNSFDFLRLFLALLVVLSHSYNIGFGKQEYGLNLTDMHSFITLGTFAVFGFFAISGFLITASLIRTKSIPDFFAKRFLRVYPGFLVCLILTGIIFAPLFYMVSGNNFLDYFSKFGLNAYNYFWSNSTTEIKSGGIGNVLDKAINKTINGPLWSLFFEIRAYILLVILSVLGLIKNKWMVLIPFLFFWFSHIGVVFNPEYNKWFATYFGDYKVACLFSYFFAGSAFYIWKDKISWNWNVFIVAIVSLTVTIFFDKFSFISPLAVTYVTLFLGFVLPIKSLAKKFGDWSYGVYIYSWPIQNLLYLIGFAGLGYWEYVSASIALSLFAGFMSWNIVEKHFLIKRKIQTT